MKKIGLLAMALIMALGALGIGYAAWTDTINVTGTVHTGTLNIDVTGYSGTWVYKVPGDIQNNEIYISRPTNVPPTGIPNNPTPFLVASAVATSGGEDAITVTFDNLFPSVDFIADATLTYTGTVPAKINSIDWDFGDVDWIERGIREGWIYATARNAQQQPVLLGFQMHQGDTVYLELHIQIPQDNTLMDLSGEFSANIEIVQWNEYPYNPPTTPPGDD